MRPFSKTKKIVIIIIIGILIVLSLNFFQEEVKGFFYSISWPIQKSLWRAGERISNFFETISEIKNLKKESDELKLKFQELLAENISLRELKEENNILREALGVGLEKEFRLTLAQVIGKDIDQDSILIDKGLIDGISKGLPVVTQQKVLLGKIVEVYENFSRAILISNKESSFDARLFESDIPGVVKGGGGKKLLLDFIPRDKEIKGGSLVISSPLGGIYPDGLLVGLIKEVKKSDIKPFQQAEISPFFDIEEIGKVFIILNF